jgi:hypothetical protein
MDSFGNRRARSATSAALLAAVLFALPVTIDAQNLISQRTAFASDRHDFANPYNNTDNYGHAQNQDKQYNSGK